MRRGETFSLGQINDTTQSRRQKKFVASTMNVVSERQRQGILPFDLMDNAIMGSDNPISRKPSADDWEAHCKTIIRLYVDEKMGLSAIQDKLRDHDFLTT